ncbi:MAG: UDP-N-acetylglucosamine 2-epimerase [Anaerolineales bacterium]|nr:UDP-N-acetylglucosamine 2-epimerase [Anaerolineales bacterium]
MQSRRICVVTGSRAEYGILQGLIKEIQESQVLELQLVVAGMHLSPEFGLTYREIEQDGFRISRTVDMQLTSDTSVGIARSLGLGTIGFGEAFHALKPDLLVLLGDRFELLAAASAALVALIPIAHIHGGELTEGAYDDAIRHSITKMAHLHFTASEAYSSRVKQLGEQPTKVFCVGALGIDNIVRLPLLRKDEVEKYIGLSLKGKSLLVTWHPETLRPERTCEDFQNLLDVLRKYESINIIFTKSNADNEGRRINQMIDEFVSLFPDNVVAYTSLGQLRYLSTLKYVSGVVGNSSSGIIEAPSLQKGTVNIGNRQLGRLRAKSVIDSQPDVTSIQNAIERLFSREFQSALPTVSNPYGEGDVASKIVSVLETCSLDGILRKRFFDSVPLDKHGPT